MKIAITVWGNRVSPVFDAARTLLVASIDNKTVKDHTYAAFKPDALEDLILYLNRMGISTLICGAISTQPADILVENNIKLVSFVSGNALDILSSFARRQTIDQTHMMPGCTASHSRA